METTLRDGADSRSTRAAPPGAPADADSGRHRYVVGVFSAPSEAYVAVAGLASGACEVLVVSDTASVRQAEAGIPTGPRVTFHPIDTSGALASQLAGTLTAGTPIAGTPGKLGPFAALGLSARNEPGDPLPPPGTQRLFQNLVHHLATGAAVVIIHAPGPEQQLQVSRALLDAKCDILLTHDVLPTGCGGSEPPAAEECCHSCTTKSCGRIDPPRTESSKTSPQKE